MLTAIALALVGVVEVESQHLSIKLDPDQHLASVTSAMAVRGSGPLRFRLANTAEFDAILIDGRRIRLWEHDVENGVYHVEVPADANIVQVNYKARFEDDVAAGERPGVIHNFSVDAHVGPDGVFLSDESAWHPRPLDAENRPMLHVIRTAIAPVRGWTFVASGGPRTSSVWETPRPVSGCALVGNQHEIISRVHETAHGPVELFMHVAPERRDKADLFLDAAEDYLDIYTPLLGAFPYPRFSIVENFFSSGFAYPGFTMLGPQVVGMAPRSLAPGYLDHELLHNWWGNGVYVDDSEGNWCEALTSYCANYYRRIADGGEDAGRAYRRGTLMKLSADPDALDDGPLATFGSADPTVPGASRFVGYDKGAFVFIMLEDLVRAEGAASSDRTMMWTALRRFGESHLGRRASWADIQATFEAVAGHSLDAFFSRWVHGHPVPRTPATIDPGLLNAFTAHFGAGPELEMVRDGGFLEFDPDFNCYRVLPPQQIVPLIGGTLGPGGVRVVTAEQRQEVQSYLPRLEPDEEGENLMLIGGSTVRDHRALLDRSGDPLTIAPHGKSFTVGGRMYDGPDEAVLHTMVHPDRPGRFITAFHSNGDLGWAKLRLVAHYRRDTTIVFQGATVLERRTFEPDRRIGMDTAR